jgi:hypothetical protein
MNSGQMKKEKNTNSPHKEELAKKTLALVSCQSVLFEQSKGTYYPKLCNLG